MATPVSTKPGWRFGVFEVDARKGELRRSGVPLKLREQSFQILLALLESPGVIVSREELRHLLWPSDTFVDFDHSLNTAMMKLRDALGDSAEAPIYIETIPKRGYRFVAPMTPIADIRDEVVVVDAKPVSTQAGSIESPSAEQAGPSRGSVHRHQIRTIVTGLGIALAVLAGTLVFLRVPMKVDGWVVHLGPRMATGSHSPDATSKAARAA